MARKTASTDTDPLDDYPAEYAACRVDRHRWSRKNVWSPAGRNFSERTRVCEDCGKVRIEVIDTKRWTRVGAVKYRDPQGYAMPRMGLTQEDYRRRHLAADLAAAQKDGRTEG